MKYLWYVLEYSIIPSLIQLMVSKFIYIPNNFQYSSWWNTFCLVKDNVNTNSAQYYQIKKLVNVKQQRHIFTGIDLLTSLCYSLIVRLKTIKRIYVPNISPSHKPYINLHSFGNFIKWHIQKRFIFVNKERWESENDRNSDKDRAEL